MKRLTFAGVALVGMLCAAAGEPHLPLPLMVAFGATAGSLPRGYEVDQAEHRFTISDEPVEHIADRVSAAQLESPAVIVVGAVAGMEA